ncbi:hypothetical protein HXX76_010102 [Chlamydomonas incerta]|uniref:Uncharacterized protein n=1 Tax=Chlamydomonas incerta TaxID=51695 RepID=A0A835SP40_CHLIN|nr:hypothetical protein HXX76_010102 [Chlamydomonas incerta]|eukprot:KAG2430584.1 hypothetical protein HXX76_010102 [Chlamydomonas incerta]
MAQGTGAAAAAPGAGPSAALPAGFFTDKAADAKARGVKLPTAEDKEAEFRAFTALIDDELKNQAVEQAEEAEVEAEEKADREAFLLRRQAERLELLRQRKAVLAVAGAAAAGAAPELPEDEELREAPPPAFGVDEEEEGGAAEGAEGAEGAEAAGTKRRRGLPVLVGKKRRVMDALAATLAASDEEGGSSSDGEGSDEEGAGVGVGGLNWRAKRV